MAEIIRMPRLSDTMEEGNIIGWLKKVGDVVAPGDVLAEVETDKATMELESFEKGTLLYIGVESGAVPVDNVIAIIGKKGEDVASILKDIAAEEKKPEPPSANGTQEVAPVAPVVEVAKVAPPAVAAPQVAAPQNDNGRIKASPLAKKLAAEANINLASVAGTGEGGRIIKRDIENYTPGSSPIPLSAPALVEDFNYGDVALTQMRKTIARRLSESKFGAPHFYLTIEIPMDAAMAARKQLNDGEDVRISYNDMIVKACASALRKHPKVNASWLDDKIRYHEEINIGVAVAIEDGLMVPVVKNADRKSLSTIYQDIRTLAGKAKDKKIGLDEMQGNTFTISNLGMFDITEFTAIINPPDACILAVGSIIEKPVVKDGEIVVGNTMKVTLSCDHRAIDGATGAKFLQSVKEFLAAPMKLLR